MAGNGKKGMSANGIRQETKPGRKNLCLYCIRKFSLRKEQRRCILAISLRTWKTDSRQRDINTAEISSIYNLHQQDKNATIHIV